ncbi:MAG: hypothetical protein K2M05_03860 [Paramuribaculum sp.]|nr:hypothetical protein [Paramuribaculum sp.]
MAVNVPYTAQLATPSFETITKADSLIIPEGKTNPIYPNGIAPSQTNCKFTLTVRLNYTWKLLGWVDYTDDYVSTFFEVPTMTYRVPIEVPVEEAGKGLYRLVNAYGQYYPFNEPGDWDPSVTSYLEINAQNPDRVYIPTCEQATDWGEGNFICSSLAYYYLSNGVSADKIAGAGYFGTLENGLITFPAGTLLFGMAGFNGGGLYDSNINGAFCVDLNSISDQE